MFYSQQVWDLQQCLDYGLKNSPDIQQSTINIDKNGRGIRSAKGLFLPSVNGGASHTYSFGSTINPETNQREGLNVQYDQIYAQANLDLFNWKNVLNLRLSKLQKESSEYRLKTVQNNLKLSIINSFFLYQEAKSWAEVLETQISGIEAQIKQTEKEVEIGVRAKSDVYDIKANLGSMQDAYISAKSQKDLAKINLLSVMNITKDSLNFEISETEFLPKEFLSTDDFVDDLVKNNPLYKEYENELKVSRQEIKVAKSDYLPTLASQYQWSTFYSKVLNSTGGTSFSDQLNLNKNQQLNFGLSIPIFNQFQVKNNVQIAKLNKIYNQLENKKQLNDLYKVLNTIMVQYQNAIEKNKALTLNFENQKLSFERSEEKYKEGLMDAYTFYVVRNNWLNANYNLIKSKYDVMQQNELLEVFKEN